MRVEELGGTALAGYDLGQCLGHGTCTAVYRASAGGDEHAVKVVEDRLQTESKFPARLRRESEVLNRIGHDGILPIREVARASGMTVVSMPLKQVPTLNDLMLRGELDLDASWGILNEIADALEAVHEQGLVSKLLKPVNILVEDGHARLAEFGATGGRIGALALCMPRFLVPQPQYIAPEQIEAGHCDQRTDVYAFGVLAFELATRTPLHESAPTAAVLRDTLNQPPPAASVCNPRLPRDVDPVLCRALARDPAQRQSTVRQLLDELVYPPPLASASAAQEELRSQQPTIPLSVVPELDLNGIEDRQSILDTFVGACVRLGRQVAGPRWPMILIHAGLPEYLVCDPPERGELVPEFLSLTRLAYGFEAVFDKEAPRHLHRWGQLVGTQWLQAIQERPPWIAGPSTGRLVDMLSVFIEALNRLRADELFSWKQVNRNMFRLVHERNIMAVGRRRPEEACHFWRGAYEAALRWAGLEKDWLVDEVDCGCVSGTYDCVFTIVRNEERG